MQDMMSADTKDAWVALSAGQIWKIDHGCILIMDRGERVVAYKKLRNPSQRAAVTNLIRPEALVSYLTQVGAELAESRQ
jgi:hypothetical protein